MEKYLFSKALLVCAVLLGCCGEPIVVDTSKQITKLFNIFAERQVLVIQNLNGIKDIISDIEITSGTSNAVLEEIKTKLENLDTSVGNAKNFCEGSNDVLDSFKEVLGTNECETGHYTCHQNATCVDLLIEYTCVCNEGLAGDGETCGGCNPGYYGNRKTCEERQICRQNSGCQRNALCKSAGGKKYCFCKDGYIGDGRNCRDVNECENNSDVCSALATCKNTQGSYSCSCNPGFQGDRHTCEDADECEGGSHNCHSDASCSNTYGGFSCSCNSGFRGDGYTCEDVDECEENIFECQPNSACKNIHGTYTCHCIPGFQGDGYNCQDVDECVVGHNCHSNATCSNNVGSFSCSCKSGYGGDGHQCQDMCPFDRVNGAGCIFFDDEEKTWADSQDNCQKRGGSLFLAKTVTQFSRLRHYLIEKTPIVVPDWTGLWVGVQENTWLDGRVVSNEEWNENHCHSSGPCCGAMMSGPPSYRLHNDLCGWTRPFICQWNQTSSQLDF